MNIIVFCVIIAIVVLIAWVLIGKLGAVFEADKRITLLFQVLAVAVGVGVCLHRPRSAAPWSIIHTEVGQWALERLSGAAVRSGMPHMRTVGAT